MWSKLLMILASVVEYQIKSEEGVVSTVALIEAVVDLGILGSLVEAQAVVEVSAVVEHLVQAQIRLENQKTPGGLTTNTDIKT